jgi:hypothetical protein
MSQLNVDIITNRAGTSGPTVNGDLTLNSGLNVSGIVTASSFSSASGGVTLSGTATASSFVSNVATGTAPLTVTSTTKVTNLNADLLDGQDSIYYTNADNLSAGTIPSARLATGTADSGTFLRGDRTWTQLTSISDYAGLEQTTGGTRKNISAIYTLNSRYSDAYYGWTSGNPYTGFSFYTYGANGTTGATAYDAEAGAWMGLGFYPASTFGNFLSNNENRVRRHISTNGNNIGPQGPYDNFYFSTNQYSYAPISIMMMPIRNNHPTLSKTITIAGVYTSYYNSGYDGSSSWIYTPGQNGTYNITSGTWTRNSVLQSNSSASTYTYTVTIPAQTTIVFMSMATLVYYSASSSSIQFFEMNKLYNLDTTFTDPFIQVDSRMINTMQFADWQRYGLTANNAFQFFKVYNACADMYGNR